MEIAKRQNGKNRRANKLFTKGFLILLCIVFIGKTTAQTADFTVNTTGSCTPIAINLTDKSVGATSWLWNFGNSNTATSQNASINYVQAGAYTVSLTINGDPKLVSKKTINAYPKPQPTIPIRVQGCEPYSGTIVADATPVTIAPFNINGTAVGGISGGQPLTYTWNFSGALPTVTQNSPILALTNVPAGSYDVLLTVTDEHGCSGSIFKESAILISPKPTADFSITKANLCGTGNVTFSASAGVASGSIANYAWDINNDGTIESTQKDYTHNFTTAGTYNIALTVSSDLQCSSTKVIKQVTFNANNSIDFSYSGSCAGQVVNFTDQSGATATKWAWDFDNNGTVDNITQNPSYSYATAGTKTAKLKVSFSDGCEKELTKSITINGATPGFTYSTALACPPTYTIGFTSTATTSVGSNITTYAWDFDNNGTTDDISKNPSHDFNAVGTFPVRLSITTDKGCTYSQLTSVIIDSTVVGLKVDTAGGCAPLLTKFTSIYKNLLDPIASYNWDFGDGQSSTQATPSHNYTLAGQYDVTLVVTTTKGCVAQKKMVKMVSVGSPQTITNITYTRADFCQKSPVNFVASVNNKIDQLIWDFGDSTGLVTQALKHATTDTISQISHTYLKPGLQSIKVKAFSNGCESLADYTLGGIQINEPTASFKASSNIECKIPTANISFKNNSISKDADTKWNWNFGDSISNDTIKNPSHIYKKAGDFKVMLTVSNSATGCVAKDSSMIYVTSVNPKFSANDTITCVRDTVIFTNLIKANSSANYKATSYTWDFGDPASGPANTSTDSIAKHRFSAPGVYSVKLKVTEERACTDSVTMTNYIDVRGPIVNFTNDKAQICSGMTVTFTDASSKTASDNAIPALNKFLWSFGDGTTSTLQNPTHTFNGTGNYTVKLEVTDNNGCVNEKSIINSVIVPAVVAGFSTTRDSYCTDNSTLINFTGTAIGTISSYDWDMDGDGVFEIMNGASTQTRIFPTKGVYTIRQRVTSNLGCQNTFTKNITIVDGTGGIVLTDPYLGCAPATAVLQAADSASVVSSYSWDFGDGKTSTLRNPTHDYLKPGKYSLTLTEVLTGGCSKSSTVIVEVGGALGTFSYSTAPSCTPYTVTLHADNLAGVGSLIWDFGDGSTFTESVAKGVSSKSISHTYAASGSKLPILILKDSVCGNSVSLFDLSKRINTNEPPVAAFGATTINGQTCEKYIVQFTDSSTLKDIRYPIASWDWDFGDGSRSAMQNPLHSYASPGNYTVKLGISNNFIIGGCNSIATKNIVVNTLPVVTIADDLQEIYTNTSSNPMTLSGTITGTTFSWTRTSPAGIVSTQALSESNVPNGGTIPGTLFTNTTISPITVNYKIVPTGPAPTRCVGDSLIASLIVDPIPSVSITKSASKPTMNNDGSYSWRYTINIINNINQKLDSIRVTDNLDDVFKPQNCDYKVTGISASGSLTANGLFNGSSNTETLVEGLSLGALQRDSIIVEVRVDTHGQKDTLTVFNQALLSCKSTMKGFTILSDANAYTVQYEKTQTNIPMVELFIPDAFSPNHDGINEQFIIAHAETMRVNLEVFNRWGNSVYKSMDYKNDWDGKGTGVLLGQDLPSGTYYINYKMTKTSTGEVISSGVKYITLKKE